MSGSTTYPTSVDNKVQLQDGIDIIQADDVNDAYVPIDAVETFIGVSGAAQSHNTDILAQIFATEKPTIKLSFVDADTVQASAGVCKAQNSGGTVRKIRKNTSTTNITGSDLDAGGPSFAANTTYYVYADGDAAATTVVFVVSTNSSTPSGVTNYELIGGFATDSSGDVIEKTVWSVAGLRIIDIQVDISSAHARTTATIPDDDTEPQNSEGGEVISITVDLGPKVTKVFVIGSIFIAGESNPGPIACLFNADVHATNAIALGKKTDEASANVSSTVPLMWFGDPPANAKTIFTVRIGASTAATNFNGEANARKYGTTNKSILAVIALGN